MVATRILVCLSIVGLVAGYVYMGPREGRVHYCTIIPVNSQLFLITIKYFRLQLYGKAGIIGFLMFSYGQVVRYNELSPNIAKP